TSIVTAGETHRLHAEGVSAFGVPLHLTNEVVYSSSDPSVATVDGEGFIASAGEGAATITATVTLNGVTKSAAAVVEVTPFKKYGFTTTGRRCRTCLSTATGSSSASGRFITGASMCRRI